MRTFKLEVALDVKAIVPEQWVKMMREYVVDPEQTTEFLKKAQELFPEDDDAFALHILKHGVRFQVRNSLHELFMASGLGCTLSPARATVIDRSPPQNAEPVLATEVAEAIPA